MVSVFTPNIQLEEPARGDQVGTWDTPVNNNSTLLDLILGGRTTIGLNNSNVVLSAAQYECKTITFNSTLTGSVAITFPTSFTKSYEVFNTCTGTSAFIITLNTTAAGGQAICCPPGEIIDIINDGTNIRFRNLGRIGTYWDYAGSSVPAWVSGCTVPPYLNCDGTTFSSATYPQLTTILGSTTLPDSRGRFRATLNQGTGRITSSGGVDGNTAYASGGSQAQNITIKSSNLPNSIPYKDAGHVHAGGQAANQTGFAGSNPSNLWFSPSGNTNNATINITINPSTAAAGTDVPLAFGTVPPSYVGGIIMIRAG